MVLYKFESRGGPFLTYLKVHEVTKLRGAPSWQGRAGQGRAATPVSASAGASASASSGLVLAKSRSCIRHFQRPAAKNCMAAS